jgi:hypothetical protein
MITPAAAAVHAALAAVGLTPQFMSNPHLNVGVIINSTSLKSKLVSLELRAAK